MGGFLPIFAYGVSTIGEAAGLLAWRWIFVSASQIHIDRICLQLSRSSAVSLPARLRSWHSLVSLGFHVARRIHNLASDCGLVSQSAEVLPKSCPFSYIPYSPDKATFLTPEESKLVRDRVERDRGDSEPDPLTWQKGLVYLCDLKLWAFGIMYLW